MSFETWLIFTLTEAAICMIPGPAVLLVVSNAFTRGSAAGVRSGVGILAANALFFVLSATGLGALLAASHEAFTILKWLGACYLLWLGAKMVLSSADHRHGADCRGRRAADSEKPKERDEIRGFIIQVANPKALMFFVSFLPQFVDPGAPLLPQLTILALTSISVEFAILTAYATLADRTAKQAHSGRLGIMMNRVGGTMLIGAAIGLASISNRQA